MNRTIRRLQSVRERIKIACLDAGRDPGEVSLLAVSKRQPTEQIISLNDLGVTDFGENQLQEAMPKQQVLANLSLQWHFIGVLQSNKTRAIAENFQWVQSVDRERILKRLSLQRPSTLPPLNICLQVNIDREPQKAGAAPENIMSLAALAQELDNITLRGLMVIPMITDDPAIRHGSFSKVKDLFEILNQSGHGMDTLSMGMSSDLETAIAGGSTMVRIGTDLFGRRKP